MYKKKYTDEFLLNEIKRAYINLGRIPMCNDFTIKKGYPSYSTYIRYFGSFNNALIIAGLPVNRSSHDETTTCSICRSNKSSTNWCRDVNKNIICSNCYRSDRNFVKGILKLTTPLAIGVITEHIVYDVLGDCIKCNNENNFHSKMDLISKKYGTIDVKASKLFTSKIGILNWNFTKNKNKYILDNYICLGFNEDKTEIQHVWIIPGNSKLVANTTIYISRNNIRRASQYEVDPEPYNKVYQNLDIYSLPEFRNLPRDIIDIKVPSIKYQEVC